jgi:hypothetical protein
MLDVIPETAHSLAPFVIMMRDTIASLFLVSALLSGISPFISFFPCGTARDRVARQRNKLLLDNKASAIPTSIIETTTHDPASEERRH